MAANSIGTVDAADELDHGRDCYVGGAWTEAYTSLRAADQKRSLEAEDLELLATSAYMLGRDDEYLSDLERAHHAHLAAGEAARAARAAVWIGITLATSGERAPASGWFGRAQRLIDRQERDCVELGYLLLPPMLELVADGDYEDAYAIGSNAIEIGERFDDADLIALAVQEQGHARLKQGRIGEGLGLLDEAMVAVTAGELSPIVTGLIYCSVIDGCRDAYDLRRAQEWTAALTRWCERQPDMVPYTGQCLIHRAEIMELHGQWREALAQAELASERFAERMKMNQVAAADALYRQGEVHRLLGDSQAAEAAYRGVRRCGSEPQPGLALLRLAQGDVTAASAGVRRLLGETTERLGRARLLPAWVEITLADGHGEEARAGSRELERIAASYDSAAIDAKAAYARGAVELADGDAPAALVALRRAAAVWAALEAAYELARTRVLVGLACQIAEDPEAASSEHEAARAVFAELGAAPDLARLDSLIEKPGAPDELHGLTVRELQVLQLVATGETNKAIAAELVISERTVDRHVSNIFAKLAVSSRAAATARAYQLRLV